MQAPEPTPLRNARGEHFTALDGFRGMAVLIVMFTHFVEIGHVLDKQTPWHNLLLSGFVGVDMFFVLSGFLITGILLDAPKTGGRFFKTFYARRTLRIFPLYYGILLIAFLFFRKDGGDSPWWYLLFASNIGDASQGTWLAATDTVVLTHLWSLAIEEQFYLIWPLLVYLLPVRKLVWTCIALLVIAPISASLFSLNDNSLGHYLFTLNRFNALAMGGLLAIAFRYRDHWTICQKTARTTLIILGPLVFIGLMFPGPGIGSAPSLSAPYLWGALLVVAMNPGGILNRFFSAPWLIFLGRISFGLYIYHSFFANLLRDHIYQNLLPITGGDRALALWLYVPIAYALSIAISLASWKWFEKPILSLNRHFKY
jgi:peptidoglycan/LPS O-acetylase OafA/YrhL